MKHEPETAIAITNARIRHLLESPDVSDWLKKALRAADGHDPITLQNEIEMLRHVFTPVLASENELALQPLVIKPDRPR